MPQSTVSRHLSLLRQRALVTTERVGTIITYRLTHPEIIAVLDTMRQIMRDVLSQQVELIELVE
jgi:ArsR family transcriptional regulator